MNKTILAFVGLVAFMCVPGLPATAATPNPVTLKATASPTPVRTGEALTVTVTATIASGWHIYGAPGDVGSGQQFGPQPTDIVSAGSLKPLGATHDIAPTVAMDNNFQMKVAFHEGTGTFIRSFRVGKVSGQTLQLPIDVHFQTCNSSICLPPKDVTVTLTVPVEPGAARSQYLKAPAVAALPPAEPPSSASPSGVAVPSAPAPPLSLAAFLLAAIAGGLLAIFTPCVFPLIPITLASFVKQASGDRGRLVRLSTGYALGIVVLYVAVGAATSALLGATGANKIASNPWVNLVEFAVFVIFALSFFEVITLQLPASLSGLQTTAKRYGDTASLVAMGMAFVVGSFTCTAPFIGTLLFTASHGAWTRPLVGMLVFAIAFASPFLVFAAFPGWIDRIPRGGVWLARTKAALGFVELAAALKFLSNADQIWQWKVLTQPVMLGIWAAIFLAGFLYLAGIWRFGIVAETEKAGARVSPARGLSAAVFLAVTVLCLWGLSGRPVGALGAFLPPAGYGGVAKADGLPWMSKYALALDEAKRTGKPLLIDFTGYTCTNCRYNEKTVFPRPEIQDALASFTRVQLYTDGGPDAAANEKLQENTFGDVSLPLYAVIDPSNGSVVSKIAGVQTPSGFSRFLHDALTHTAKS